MFIKDGFTFDINNNSLEEQPPVTSNHPTTQSSNKKRKFEELSEHHLHVLARKYNLEEEVDFNQVVHQYLHSDANKIMSLMQQPEKIVDYFNLRRDQTRELPFMDKLLALKARPQKHLRYQKASCFSSRGAKRII